MITLAHIFPIESSYCRFSEDQESALTSLATTDTKPTDAECCVLRTKSTSTLKNLLFQCAVSYATKDANVTYICQQPLANLPPGVHGMPKPEPNVLKTVKFLYMKTVEEVVEFCATIHTRVLSPDLLILEDIEGYIEQLEDPCLEHKAAKLCALLCDAVNFIKSKNEGPRHLLLSCTDSSNRLLSVFRNSGIQVLNVEELQSDKFQMTTTTGSKDIGVEFSSQKGETYLQNFRVKETS